MITGYPVSFILFLIVALFYGMDFYFMQHFDPARTDNQKGWAWDYTLFTMLLGLIIILQPILLPQLSWRVISPWGIAIQVMGLLCVIASFTFHIWARVNLKKYYTERIEVQSDHHIIDTGPYAIVRHPIITSFFVFVFGIFLINPAWTTLAIAIYIFWDFYHAALQEEELLSVTLPDYVAYMDRTSQFLPRPWMKR